MKFSVIVPVYNGERTLAECLQALSAQDYPHFEVILVDNNSRDASVSIIRDFIQMHPGFEGRLLHEPVQGACRARNAGACQASGEILVHTDPDCIPIHSWLRELAVAFTEADIAAVAGNIDTRKAVNIFEVFSALFTLPSRDTVETHRKYTLMRGGFATANLAIRREWFDRLGGFDESINYKGVGIGEDHDLLARLYELGGKLKAIPGAIVLHWHRTDLRGLLRQGFLFGLAHALLLRRHGKKRVLINAGGKEFIISCPFRVWLDLDGLDKKVVLLLMLAFVHPTGLLLIMGYLLWQTKKMGQRLQRKGFKSSLRCNCAMVLLLFCKSGAMTIGRLRGSLSQRVWCI